MGLVQLPLARAKLDNTKRHIAELERGIADYLSRGLVLPVGFERRGGGQYQFQMIVHTFEPPPLSLGLIFGDALHNLMGSLDWLINERVSLRTRPATDLAFPFSKAEEGFGRQIREKMKDTTEAERQLVKQLKPYSGGNEALLAVHGLNLQDKHRSPLRVAAAVVGQTMTMAGIPNDPHAIHHGRFLEVPAEHEALFPSEPGFTRLGIIEEAQITIAIADDLPFGSREVIEALSEMSAEVGRVIERFEALPA